MCGMSSLPNVLWIVVSRFVALVIVVSLRFTSSRPKHSNNAVEILVHSNMVMVYFRSPKQLTSFSRKPWDLYGIQTELWFVCGMSSLPYILWTDVSRSVALVIEVSLWFTSNRPKHSNSAAEILVHSNRVTVFSSSPK